MVEITKGDLYVFKKDQTSIPNKFMMVDDIPKQLNSDCKTKHLINIALSAALAGAGGTIGGKLIHFLDVLF